MATENTKATEDNGVLPNPEPDWSLTMFWEDITAVFLKLIDVIRSIFRYFE